MTPSPAVREALGDVFHRTDSWTDLDTQRPETRNRLTFEEWEIKVVAAVRADVLAELLTGASEGPWSYRENDDGEWALYFQFEPGGGHHEQFCVGDEPEARAVANILNLLARKEAP